MQCPKCHAEAVDGRRFCKICGTALISPAQTQPVVGAASVERVAVSTNGQSTPTVNCPKCGSTITTGRPFCGRCGAKLGTPQQARSAAPAVTRATRPPARPRKPINWRKVGPPVGVLTLLAGVAIGAWHFWPRVLLPPEKTGTIFDRATSGNSVVFNRGVAGEGTSLLLTGSEIWEIPSRESVFRGSLPANFFSPDGRFVFDGTSLYDWRANKRTGLENPPPQSVSFNGTSQMQNQFGWVGFSNRSNLVAGARPNGSLFLLDTATGKIVHTLREGGAVYYVGPKMTCFVSSLAFTSDDAILASGEINGNISLWNTKTGDLVATLSDKDRPPCEGSTLQAPDQVFAVAFSPSGDLLASQDQFGTVRVWDVSSHKVLYSSPLVISGGSKSVGFSKDGHFLVASGGFWENGKPLGTLLLLDATSGQFVGALSLPGQTAFGFLPDDSLVTAQSSDARVKVEKWALRSRFRVPFISSTPPSVEKSDSTLLHAYEESALQSLVMFQGVLGRYFAGDGHGTFSKNIKDAMEMLPIANIPGAETNNLELQGYRFSYTAAPSDSQGSITSYTISAQPLLYQQTGTRSFLVDQTGQVHVTNEAREATTSDSVFRSLQDATQGSTTIPNAQPAQAAAPAPAATPASSPSRPSTTAEVNQWLARAQAQFEQGDYRGALQSCDAALRLDPTDARVKQLKAKVESTMKILGQPPQASASVRDPVVRVSPVNGSVFSVFSGLRTTQLVWREVPGAKSYTVERVFLQNGQHCISDADHVDASARYDPVVVNQLNYSFDFVGAQPGCWRVWAVYADGTQGPKGDWWEFRYTR